MRGSEKEGGSPGSLVSSPLAYEEGHDPARAVGRSTGSGNQREWHPGTRTSPCTPYIQEGGAKKPKGSKINDPHRCAYSHMDGDGGGTGGWMETYGRRAFHRIARYHVLPISCNHSSSVAWVMMEKARDAAFLTSSASRM